MFEKLFENSLKFNSFFTNKILAFKEKTIMFSDRQKEHKPKDNDNSVHGRLVKQREKIKPKKVIENVFSLEFSKFEKENIEIVKKRITKITQIGTFCNQLRNENKSQVSQPYQISKDNDNGKNKSGLQIKETKKLEKTATNNIISDSFGMANNPNEQK